MIIDVRGHIGESTRAGPAEPQLEQHFHACGIARMLVSNLDAAPPTHRDEVDANLACLAICRDDPRLAPLFWARTGAPDSHPRAVEGALATESFCGLVLAPALHGLPADSTRLDPYLAAAARCGKPIIVLVDRTEEAGPARVYQAARRHRGTWFILSAASADAPIAEMLDIVQRARRRDDALLALETSYMPPDDALAAVRSVGPHRVLFGSGYGLARAATERSLQALARLREQLPPEDFSLITGQNAQLIFGLQNGDR